eukprot:COSAG01_NODE_8492_length_2766_cov_5.493063_2_plen_409_part_00
MLGYPSDDDDSETDSESESVFSGRRGRSPTRRSQRRSQSVSASHRRRRSHSVSYGRGRSRSHGRRGLRVPSSSSDDEDVELGRSLGGRWTGSGLLSPQALAELGHSRGGLFAGGAGDAGVGGTLVGLSSGGSTDPYKLERWPEPGATAGEWGGCCCFEWDPAGEFDRHQVETVVRNLTLAGGGKYGTLSVQQGELLLTQLRLIGHMQRDAALALRRAHLLELASFACGVASPLLVVVAMQLALSDDFCGGGSGGFAIVGVLAVLLGLAGVGLRAYERWKGIKHAGLLGHAVACEMKAEANNFLLGMGSYERQRVALPQLLHKLRALSSWQGLAALGQSSVAAGTSGGAVVGLAGAGLGRGGGLGAEAATSLATASMQRTADLMRKLRRGRKYEAAAAQVPGGASGMAT